MRPVLGAKRESHLRLGFACAGVPYQRANREGRNNGDLERASSQCFIGPVHVFVARFMDLRSFEDGLRSSLVAVPRKAKVAHERRDTTDEISL